MILSIFFI